MSPRKTVRSAPPRSFEENLRRLEEIVGQLEDGSVPLEKALVLYEEGITLSKTCMDRLREAEKKLEILRKNGSDDLLGETD